MVTFVGQQEDLINAIKSLIELDYDAIKAYESATHRLQNDDYIETLNGFKSDHARHVKELSSYLTQHHQTPPHEADVKSVLTQGKVVIAGLINDEAILKAMLSNEEDTNTAYERICSRSDLPDDLLEILKRGLEDEKKHYNWIKQTLNNNT